MQRQLCRRPSARAQHLTWCHAPQASLPVYPPALMHSQLEQAAPGRCSAAANRGAAAPGIVCQLASQQAAHLAGATSPPPSAAARQRSLLDPPHRLPGVVAGGDLPVAVGNILPLQGGGDAALAPELIDLRQGTACTALSVLSRWRNAVSAPPYNSPGAALPLCSKDAGPTATAGRRSRPPSSRDAPRGGSR